MMPHGARKGQQIRKGGRGGGGAPAEADALWESGLTNSSESLSYARFSFR